jgi:hypothetical protein
LCTSLFVANKLLKTFIECIDGERRKEGMKVKEGKKKKGKEKRKKKRNEKKKPNKWGQTDRKE